MNGRAIINRNKRLKNMTIRELRALEKAVKVEIAFRAILKR